MAVAETDDNNVRTMIGLLNTDGVTPTKCTANPTTNLLQVEDSAGGSDAGNNAAYHDNNNTPTLIAVSSADGTTPAPLFVDSSGRLLINSN